MVTMRIFYADAKTKIKPEERWGWIKSVCGRIRTFSKMHGNCTVLTLKIEEPDVEQEYSDLAVDNYDFFILHKGNKGKDFSMLFDRVREASKQFVLFGGSVSDDDKRAFGEDKCFHEPHVGSCPWQIEEFLEEWMRAQKPPNVRILKYGTRRTIEADLLEIEYDLMLPVLTWSLTMDKGKGEHLKGVCSNGAASLKALVDDIPSPPDYERVRSWIVAKGIAPDVKKHVDTINKIFLDDSKTKKVEPAKTFEAVRTEFEKLSATILRAIKESGK
jgi:hypothetical protein